MYFKIEWKLYACCLLVTASEALIYLDFVFLWSSTYASAHIVRTPAEPLK
jgi:hypothetical protein